MQCFVCSELLVGDDGFLRFHLNQCLDRQGSSGSGRNKVEQPHPASRIDTGSSNRPTMTDARQDQNERATHSATQDVGERGKTTSELACPCCAVPWRDLDLEADGALDHRTGEQEEEQQRAAHVEACLFAAQQEAVDSDLDSSRSARMVADKDKDRSSSALHGMAEEEEEEESERKGRQVAAHGRSAKDEGGGDAADETSVNSTPGLIHLLAHALNASHASPHGRTSEAYLATEHVEHVSTRLKDYGWGCGYKNAQMIYSAFRHIPQLEEVLSRSFATRSASGRSREGARTPDEGKKGVDVTPIPPIRWWQETIEAAWKQGYDPDGAAHFRNRLVNSRRWIGTTEIFTALSYTGIQTLIVDFPKSKGTSGTNLNLVNFIVDYFRTPNFLGTAPAPSTSTSTSNPSPKEKNAFEVLTSSGGTAIHRTEKQPLYLQHHGHSRTIVGIEIGKRSKVEDDDDDKDGGGASVNGNGRGRGKTVKSKIRGMASKGKHGDGEGGGEEEVWLLLFDPGKPIPQDFKKAAASLAAPRQAQQADNEWEQEEDGSPPASKKPRPDQPQSSTSRRGSPTDTRRNGFGSAARIGTQQPLPKFGEVLKLFRVNMRELKKKDDYQVLFVDPDAAPLSAEEKARKKRVTSIVIGGD